MIARYEPNPPDPAQPTKPRVLRILDTIIIASFALVALSFFAAGVSVMIQLGSRIFELAILITLASSLIVMVGAGLARVGLLLFKYARFSLRTLLFALLWLGFWIALIVGVKDNALVQGLSLCAIVFGLAMIWDLLRKQEPR